MAAPMKLPDRAVNAAIEALFAELSRSGFIIGGLKDLDIAGRKKVDMAMRAAISSFLRVWL